MNERVRHIADDMRRISGSIITADQIIREGEILTVKETMEIRDATSTLILAATTLRNQAERQLHMKADEIEAMVRALGGLSTDN